MRNKKMKDREIKAQLIKKGIKQVHIAIKEDVSEALVSLVIKGERKTLKVRRAIARALRMPYKKLWGKAA